MVAVNDAARDITPAGDGVIERGATASRDFIRESSNRFLLLTARSSAETVPRTLRKAFDLVAGASIRRATQILGLIPSPGTRPRSLITGQHCREAFLQILDEILGNLQRREMSPGFGRPP
jgi:hypothetical protein